MQLFDLLRVDILNKQNLLKILKLKTGMLMISVPEPILSS